MDVAQVSGQYAGQCSMCQLDEQVQPLSHFEVILSLHHATQPRLIGWILEGDNSETAVFVSPGQVRPAFLQSH